MQPCDSSLVIDTAAIADTWCAFEHHVQLEAGKPPEIILVGACKLVEVYRCIEGKTNSEWAAMFANGGQVLIRIIATGTDRSVIAKFAAQHARQLTPMPRCNLRGFNMRGTSRPIKDMQTGTVYESQQDAALALGLNQSAISRHMRGQLKHVGGKVFSYVGAGLNS